MYDVIIIGAGPAGLMAGISAAKSGAGCLVIEHMKDAGRKLLITGKGRCNITNVCDVVEIIKNIPGNGVFLNSALRMFDNRQLMAFFAELGIATKVERGGRVFPASDKAVDIRNALVKEFSSLGGKLLVNNKVEEILTSGGQVAGVKTAKQTFPAKCVILASGGASYPGTGSDGSGFLLARAVGHTVVEPKASLVPLVSDSPYLSLLQGLSLRNVRVTIVAEGKEVKNDFGEMLFTHFGFSGPIILSLSNIATKILSAGKKIAMLIDLKPALQAEVLDARVQRDFAGYSRKQIKNALFDLMPKSLVPVVLQEAGIDQDKFVNQITREERGRLVSTVKALRFNVKGVRPLAEAIVTAGGVNIKEIEPQTMSSKLIAGLYFAGEVIDIDGYTGGFNLQAAFSTGYVAGTAAAQFQSSRGR